MKSIKAKIYEVNHRYKKVLDEGEIMGEEENSNDLIIILNKAIARDIQVFVQYMLQHSTWIAKAPANPKDTPSESQRKFVGTHFPY
jgi:hypothetical protein